MKNETDPQLELALNALTASAVAVGYILAKSWIERQGSESLVNILIPKAIKKGE